MNDESNDERLTDAEENVLTVLRLIAVVVGICLIPVCAGLLVRLFLWSAGL